MRRTIALTALLLAALPLNSCGTAEPDGDDLADFVPPTLTRRDEMAKLLDTRFERLDANRDRGIAADELGPRRAARFPQRDTNKDGRIDHDEFVATGLARFDRLDTNHDAVLTNVERDAGR